MKFLKLSISSGKGGVGKSLSCVMMGLNLSLRGYKVLLLDGDHGMTNLDVLLGIRIKKHLGHVYEGLNKVSEIITHINSHLDLLSFGSSHIKFNDSSGIHFVRDFFNNQETMTLFSNYNFVIMDSGAGNGSTILELNSNADFRLICCTPEPHSLTDAYALMKVLKMEKNIDEFNLIINMAHSHPEGQHVFAKFFDVCNKYLNIKLNLSAVIPLDPVISKSIMNHALTKNNALTTLAAQAYNRFIQSFLEQNSIMPLVKRTHNERIS